MLFFCLSIIDTEEEKHCFEHIFLTYRQDMFKLAKSILKNKEDAEDAVGDVFLKIASKHMSMVSRITNEDDLRNYLLKATKHTAYNMCELHAKRNVSLEELTEEGISNATLTDDSFLDIVLTKMECDQVVDIINNLNDTYQDVLYDHFVLGCSLSEIASSTGKSITTIKKQLQRGKKLVIKEFENDERNG